MKDKGSLEVWRCLRNLETGNMGQSARGLGALDVGWGSEIGRLGTSAEALEFFLENGAWLLEIWGRSAEGLEASENMGF